MLRDVTQITRPQMKRYKFLEEIGCGSFSTVWKVRNVNDNRIYACKLFPKSNLTDDGVKQRFQREINTMAAMRHPYLVALTDFFSDEETYYLILDYCGGGDLFGYLCDNDKLDEITAAFIFKEIVHGLSYCHGKGIAHRDLKPENILIDEFPFVKISDFGLCGYIDDKKLMNTFCGSPSYCAPECLSHTNYDGRASDIWSLGIILFAMVTGEHPWNLQNVAVMMRQILSASFAIPDYVSPSCKDLIKKMLRVNPHERADLTEILNHPWLRLADEMAECKPKELPELGEKIQPPMRSDCIVSPFLPKSTSFAKPTRKQSNPIRSSSFVILNQRLTIRRPLAVRPLPLGTFGRPVVAKEVIT